MSDPGLVVISGVWEKVCGPAGFSGKDDGKTASDLAAVGSLTLCVEHWSWPVRGQWGEYSRSQEKAELGGRVSKLRLISDTKILL